MTSFSNFYRNIFIETLKTQTFDLLIIGGGITGAGIALDASSRGLKVALIEKNDFASGTSSKSTKLIHGGLRYLKQFDFWLVKEVGTERAVVHQLAPHLVVPEKMLLPIIKNGTYGSWLTSIGLKIYDILASVENEDKRKMLNKVEALKLEPLLSSDILEGAGHYAEYRTDDARLTLEILKTAFKLGALVLNYTKLIGFDYKNQQISGAQAIDTISGLKFNIKAKYTINATGPWADQILNIQNTLESFQKKLHLTKGVHIVLPHYKLPVKQSIYFDVPDGRMIFAIPRGNTTYVGTTETNFHGDLNQVKVEQVDALYLISAINNMFKTIELDLNDILSSWAGLRPLIHQEGKLPGELSRKDEIFQSNNGLISIVGGKLTGYRKMAERIVDLTAKKLDNTYRIKSIKSQTEQLKLCGGDFKDYTEVIKYTQSIYQKLNIDGFSLADIKILVHRYGKQCDTILNYYRTLNQKDFKTKLLKAEIWFSIHHEMVQNPEDFIVRRTGKLYFEIDTLETQISTIIDEFSHYFAWSLKERKLQTQKVKTLIKVTTQFN